MSSPLPLLVKEPEAVASSALHKSPWLLLPFQMHTGLHPVAEGFLWPPVPDLLMCTCWALTLESLWEQLSMDDRQVLAIND